MWHSGKEFTSQFRRCKFILWVRKIPGKGNGNPFWYSCLENSMGKGAWQQSMRSQKNQTQLIMHTHTKAHIHTRSSLLTSSLDSAVLPVLLPCCGVCTVWLTWEGFTQQHLFKGVHQLSVPLSWHLFNVFPIVNKWLGRSSRAAYMTKIIYL